MRRILNACLQQTMRFDTMGEIPPEKEYELYCEKMNKKGVKYVVDEKTSMPDGSLVIKIRRQYNTYPADGYLEQK